MTQHATRWWHDAVALASTGSLSANANTGPDGPEIVVYVDVVELL